MTGKGSTLRRVGRPRIKPLPILEALTRATQASAELERDGSTAVPASSGISIPLPTEEDPEASSAEDTEGEDEE